MDSQLSNLPKSLQKLATKDRNRFHDSELELDEWLERFANSQTHKCSHVPEYEHLLSVYSQILINIKITKLIPNLSWKSVLQVKNNTSTKFAVVI
jgi:hypothetical protein